MAEQPNIADEQLSEGHHVEPSTKFEPRVMDAEKMLQCICGSGKLSSSEDDGNLISCEKCKTRQHTVCYYPDQENETLGEDFHHICFDCAHHTSFEDATDTTDDEEEDESVDEYTSGFSEASASASQFGEASTDGNNMPNVFFYMTQDVQYAPATGEQSLPSTPSGGAYNSTDDTLQISSINQAAQEFREQFFALSQIPSRWEDPKRLDEALETIPLDLIHEQAQKAEEEAVLKRAQNLDLNKEKQDPDEWGHSDFIIMALLQWFKQDFFKWETNSVCPVCSSPTKAQGETEPTAQEREDSALVVELYMCCNQECGASERFPRYSDPFRLLGTKRGRLAEWANCFGMLCRAVEARVRWVWNADKGHIWLEVFSEAKTRWVSIDVFEAAWDQPLLYTEGKAKHFSFFSSSLMTYAPPSS